MRYEEELLRRADDATLHLGVVRALLIEGNRNFDEAIVKACIDIIWREFGAYIQPELEKPIID